MKRGTIDHPKLRALTRALGGVPRYQAVGLLESLWHFTALYAWQGDVGKHSDAAIAEWVGWQGSPDALIDALTSTGWLERVDGPGRLLVHDWSEHCDDSVKKRMSRQSVDTRATCPSDGETCPDLSGHVLPRAGGYRLRQKAQTEGGAGETKPTGFKTWTRDDLAEAVASANADNLLTAAEAAEFIDYWCEKSSSGRLKVTMEKTWDTRRRMATALEVVYSKRRASGQPRQQSLAIGQVYHEESPLGEWK